MERSSIRATIRTLDTRHGQLGSMPTTTTGTTTRRLAELGPDLALRPGPRTFPSALTFLCASDPLQGGRSWPSVAGELARRRVARDARPTRTGGLGSVVVRGGFGGRVVRACAVFARVARRAEFACE